MNIVSTQAVLEVSVEKSHCVFQAESFKFLIRILPDR